MTAPLEPTLRKPVGVLALIAGITAYAAAIASFWPAIGRLHPLLQPLVYLVLGTVWILPVRPLLTWIETGRWTGRRARGEDGASDGT